MTGIRVNFDLTFSNKAWVEAERYRFLEFVSSQSTMHCITKFDLNEQYNEYVDPRIIEIMREKVDIYNKLLSIIDRIKHCETENKNEKIKMLEQLEEIRKEKKSIEIKENKEETQKEQIRSREKFRAREK